MGVNDERSLDLYEEFLLLQLRDEKGPLARDLTPRLVSGAILGDLWLQGRISVENTHDEPPDLQWVTVQNNEPTGGAILDESLEDISAQ